MIIHLIHRLVSLAVLALVTAGATTIALMLYCFLRPLLP